MRSGVCHRRTWWRALPLASHLKGGSGCSGGGCGGVCVASYASASTGGRPRKRNSNSGSNSNNSKNNTSTTRKDHRSWLFAPERQAERDAKEVSEGPAVVFARTSHLDPHAANSTPQCAGCGVELQAEKPERLGYVPPHLFAGGNGRAGKTPTCQRCHQLRYQNQSPVLSKRQFPLSQLKTMPAVIVKLVDIIDFDGTWIRNFVDTVSGDNPVILVGNKVDLLPKDAHLERVRAWLQHAAHREHLRPVATLLVSSRSGMGVRRVLEEAKRVQGKRDIYVVGVSNVGKSTFLNQVLHRYGARIHTPLTVSSHPGTTIGLVRFPLANGTNLVDTPGTLNSHQVTGLLTAEERKVTMPGDRLVPTTIRLVPGKTVWLGGLARLDYVEGEGPILITLFVSKRLSLHLSSVERSEGLWDRMAGEPPLQPPMGRERAAAFPPLCASPVSTQFFDEALETAQRMAQRHAVTAEQDAAHAEPQVEDVVRWLPVKRALMDVVFSGLGWASVALGEMPPGLGWTRAPALQAWAPEGAAVMEREPLMPFEALPDHRPAVPRNERRRVRVVRHGKFRMTEEQQRMREQHTTRQVKKRTQTPLWDPLQPKDASFVQHEGHKVNVDVVKE